MGSKSKERVSKPQLDSFAEFDDHELRSTMEEFLREEKKANSNIWNFATIAGIAMFFVGVLFMFQAIGLSIGPDLSGFVEVMPLIGGILVTLIGFGFIAGERSKDKSRSKSRKKSRSSQFDFSDEDFGSEDFSEESFGLDNDLKGGFSSSRKRRKSKSGSGSLNFDSYALRQPKKLYKSRTDRKWAGVCGGLAKYFGISSTVIRLLFVITFFAGSGTSLLIYCALAIALDKEPPELMDDFNY